MTGQEREATINAAFQGLNEIIQDQGKDCAHVYFKRGLFFMEYFNDYKRALYDFSAAIRHKEK